MTTGSVLKYLLEGCLNIRVLCYSLYEDQVGKLVADHFSTCHDRSTLWRTRMSSSCFWSTRCLPSLLSTLRSVFWQRRWNFFLQYVIIQVCIVRMIAKQEIDGILRNMDRWKPDWDILEFLPPRPSTSKSSLPWDPLRVSFHNKSTHLFYWFLPFMWSSTCETCSLSTMAYFCLNNLLVTS